MSRIKSIKNNISNLRKDAEEKLIKLDNTSTKKINNKKSHELEIHKIELEMQHDELIATQAKLLKSIEEYTELFEYSPIGYFILDEDGIIKKVNETGCKLLGYNKKEIQNKNLSLFIHSKASQDNFYRHKNLVIETKKQKQFECKIKKKDGTLFYSILEGLPVKDEKNNFKFLFYSISNITKQKQQELALELALKKEKELNKMKTQFITIASHEFRTPLATILTSSELAEKYDQPNQNENRKSHFKKIKNSIKRMEEILIDFLSANDIEKGKIKNNPELVNLVEFIKKIIKETAIINGTHIITYKHIGKYEDAMLDIKLLKTCLTNLIINAYKYTPPGGKIDIVSEQRKHGNITIKVKDTGIGIEERDKKNIFKQFFRAHNVENIQGTGIGLNITKKIITIIGGSISFTSKKNIGSTFILKIPK